MNCPACGVANRPDARFCDSCGTSLAAAAEEHRKVVSVLFCDLVGSTALGESNDPEALRALLARYFERMRSIVERHGGTVEKFVGDAIMAVFGVPAAHEDDALRACRAAVEMQAAFPELGVHGRIGVNTGEVVAGTAERLATGDAVNVAQRLEAAAAPDETLIGEATLAFVRDAVEAQPVEPLPLKGKAQPVPAHRLIAVHDRPEPSFETRFVGRRAETELLHAAWNRARRERRCELVTIVGGAGVGKSRLVAETLADLDVRTVRGRCPPYGEGITYWPVVEVVKQLGTLPADPAAAASLRALLGEGDRGTSSEEIAWAFRKLLEQEAPLAVVFDDIHNGEETFLDLVEHVALLSSGAPLLLLCMARPELTARRGEWPVALPLHPLDDADVDELIGDRVPGPLRERIARAAGGNPLFVSEMLAMAAGDVEVEVPPSLRALLAARLDTLDGPERQVLERGAVEGEVFHRGAVQALAPDRAPVTPRLAALVRKELISPDRAVLPGDDGFRFRHLLIRDAAYDALPKSVRAELHERFAGWLEERGAGLVELDEILGYHLEQAARCRQELGQADDALAQRAADHLAAAGRRALWRADHPAAVSLLERAAVLTRALRLDAHLEVDLADAYGLPNAQRAATIAEAAAEKARAAGDEPAAILARVVAAYYRAWFADDPATDELDALARRAVPLLERAGDHAGLVHVWWALSAAVENMRGCWGEATRAHEQAIREARLAGQRRSDLAEGQLTCLVYGPCPAGEALRTVEELLPDAPTPWSSLTRAGLLAMLGRFDEAWPVALEANARLREMTDYPGEEMLGPIAALAGDDETAAEYLRQAYEIVERQGIRAALSTVAPLLARSLCSLGRHDEAERHAQLGRELGAPNDVATQMLWRQAQALVEAHRGDHDDAERLAREAVEIAETTDGPNFQGDALCDLAEVLLTAGRTVEAAAALEQALERYERKQNLAMAGRVRERLVALQPAAR